MVVSFHSDLTQTCQVLETWQVFARSHYIRISPVGKTCQVSQTWQV